MRMVITNVKPRPIEDINFDDISMIHFLVISDDKYESYWTELKKVCKAKFITCDIHFIIPKITEPHCLYYFADAFGNLINDEPPRVHND